MTLQVGKLVEVVGGELVAGSAEVMVNGLALDSRDVDPGAAFVAFVGERADGHIFAADAVARGARALLVTRVDEALHEAAESARQKDCALVLVSDPERAVGALASYHRDRLHCPVVGVTGSTGKTTTKDLLASVFSISRRVVATEGNRNNELGVPLTVMEAGADTDVLVVEMAMRGLGQIGRLCDIARPTAGLVTNVGVSHIEVLGSQEAIRTAKGELVVAVPESGAVFLNGDDVLSVSLADWAAAPVILYGLGETCEVRGVDISMSPEGTAAFEMTSPSGCSAIRLRVPGRHNVYNALAAAAVGMWLGVGLDEIAEGLEAATLTDMRMQLFTSAGGISVINDAYNASPSSMRAALETLAEMETLGARVAVLGDMAELGSLADLAHFQLGEYAGRIGLDTLVTVGILGRRIAEGARAAGMKDERIRPCATVEEASEVLDDILESGDLVLVKASRVVGLERVLGGIIEPHVSAG